MNDTDSRSATLAEPAVENSQSPPESLNKEETVNDKTTDADRNVEEETVEHEVKYETGLRLTFIIIALLLSIFLVALDMTIVGTAIPKITDEFRGIDLVGWYGSAFFLTVGAFQSTWGKAYKYFPLKTTFLTSIAVFELGSLICGVAPNSTALIVGRAIAGLGGAGIASGSYTIIAFAAPPAQRAAYTGLLGAAYGLASVVGPLLGGVFADKVTWRWCFYINLPIGAVSVAIILFSFTTPAHAVPTKAPLLEKLLQMDLPGAFVIMAAIICFLLAIQWGGQTKPWNDSEVIGLLVGFGLILILFFVIEYFQGERAMIVGRLLKDRHVSVGMGFIFFLGGAFFILLYFLPIYFQVVSGVSASQSGIRNLPLIIAVVIGTIASGAAISATGHYVPWLIGGSVIATIGAGLIYTLDIGTSSGKWIGYQVLAGLGLGVSFQVPIIAGQAVVAASDLSSTTAMILFAQTIGGAFFVSASQTGFTNELLKALPSFAPSVDPKRVLTIGITEIRSSFAADEVQGIIRAYMQGLHVSFALAIGCVGVSVLFAFASKWTNLKGKMQPGGAL
ncbi:hypothetical protein HYFRA_00000080 [Hymenoscyphus fraxineus]|uniref:Major facilitator superfamily (MFS) profile domain-containing protein n=1 Tax=Hymenoscyphus fraxineus TaxID=746836 RepID=A0A9N9PXK8_9HELO|nr:hypothetical protein HYFRA_00000080 [Hymenoscyphus fraxineus]